MKCHCHHQSIHTGYNLVMYYNEDWGVVRVAESLVSQLACLQLDVCGVIYFIVGQITMKLDTDGQMQVQKVLEIFFRRLDISCFCSDPYGDLFQCQIVLKNNVAS